MFDGGKPRRTGRRQLQPGRIEFDTPIIRGFPSLRSTIDDAQRRRDVGFGSVCDVCNEESDCPLGRLLRLSTGRWRRDPTRHATQQTVDSFSLLEAGQVAGDDGTRRGEFGEMLTHLRYRNAGLSGEFRVESLTVLFEAIKDFGHGGHRWKGVSTVTDPELVFSVRVLAHYRAPFHCHDLASRKWV